MRTLSIFAAGLLLASIAALPARSTPAVSAQGVEHASDLSAQSKNNRKKRTSGRRGYDSRASGQQIACTQLGCNPIPRGCRVVPGKIPFTWDPSGFDDVICPYPR
jgi:hypothetical protein